MPKLRDAVLGELVYESELDWWRGTLSWPDDGVVGDAELHLWADLGLPEQPETLQALGLLLGGLHARAAALRREVAARMLALAEDWRDEDETPEPLTAQSVAARLRVEAVELTLDGQSTVYYNDDDLFAGHVIVVSLDADGRITTAKIAG